MIYTILLCIGVAALDQISKLIVVNMFDIGDSFTLIPGIVDIHRIEPNRGALAGMLSDARWVFMIVSVIAIAAIFFYVAKEKPKSMFLKTCLGIIAGGGVGNMIDRVARGAVEDFIDVTCTDILCFKYVFNVADIFVTVGCLALICYLLFVEIPKEAKESKKKAVSTAETDNTENNDEQ